MSNISRHLLESKLITDEEWKEYKQLKKQKEKAIEYLNKTVFNEKGYINFCYELENILKGDSDE